MKKILFLCLSLITTVQALSQITPVNVGTTVNDRTGDPVRTAFQKLNANDVYLNEQGVVRLDSLLDASFSPIVWGNLTGTLSDQTDLQTAFDAKVPITRTINSQPLSGDVTLTKSDFGLSNVDNTSDVNKPVSTAQAAADALKVDKTTTVNGSPLSSNVTVSTITGNAGTATALQTGRTIGTITGDATSAGSSFDGTANNTNALTLATVNSNVGSFGSATQSLTVTVNAKGLITAVSGQTVTPAITSVTGLGTGVGTFLATPTSANLATALTDESGTGTVVFSSVTDSKASLTGTETLTNKRITARVQSVSSSATVTPNADSDDAVKVTAQAAGLTLANPSGTPTGMQAMVIRIKDNGTARSISFGNQYRAIGVTLPTTTVISKTMYLGIIWNADDSKWDVIGYSLEN
jgi:hypothetical protein